MPTGKGVASAYTAPDNKTPIGDYVTAVGRSSAPDYFYSPRAPWPGGDDGNMDHPGGEWAPELRGGAEGLPDAHRTQSMPLYEYGPAGNQPPAQFWQGPNGPTWESRQREIAVETVDGDGWRMARTALYALNKRAAPDVRRTPPPEPRPTQQMAPVTYSYTRPFDQSGNARNLNGNHFSMADHRRNYPIYGMQPVSNRRNTFRADPQPWDTDIVDKGPVYTPAAARITSVDLPARGWRLQ